jgi:hypothetical protein
MAMDIESHFMSRSDGRMFRALNGSDLPPAQAGVAAALRRAFDLPADETERKFEELLARLC